MIFDVFPKRFFVFIILIASRDPTSPSANQAYSQPAKQKPAISVTEIGARGYPKEATRSENDKKRGGV